MPIYEYECSKCKKIIEVTQKISDQPLKKCKDCGGALEKLLSLTSFSLKGTGWYTTDYKRTGKTASSNAAASSVKNEPSTQSVTQKTDSKTSEKPVEKKASKK